MADLAGILLNAVNAVLILILVTLGLAVVFGLMRVINMAHGELVMLGAYTVVALDAVGAPFWLAVAAAPVAVGALGLVIEWALIRHVYHRALDTILATWGLSILLKQAVVLGFGPASYSVAAPIEASLSLGDFTYPVYRLVLMAIAAAVIAATFWVFLRTDFGLMARATIARPETAACLGIDTRRLNQASFAVGSAVAGLAGALVAPLISVDPQLGLGYLVPAFLSILVGGAGPLAGVLVGGGIGPAGRPWWWLMLSTRALALAVFVAMTLLPLVAGEYWTGQMVRYLVYGLLAMSLSLVWGRGGILCFGQAMFFGIGGYAMAVLTKGMLGAAMTSSYLGLICAVAAPAGFAAGLGYFLFWGRGLSGPYLAIVTLAMAVILERIMSNWDALGGYNGLLDIPPLDLGVMGARLELWDPVPQFYAVLAVVAAVYIAIERLLASPYGVVLAAVKANPTRIEFFGYQVFRIRLTVFVLGAAVAGLAGALFVSIDGFASPTLIGFGLSTETLVWVALGGREMVLAAFLGAVAVRLMEAYFSEILGAAWILALGLAFMLSVVLLPRGLIATPLARLAGR
jgi:ABC-type branched-subunit amino acid transport system permease subunit